MRRCATVVPASRNCRRKRSSQAAGRGKTPAPARHASCILPLSFLSPVFSPTPESSLRLVENPPRPPYRLFCRHQQSALEFLAGTSLEHRRVGLPAPLSRCFPSIIIGRERSSAHTGGGLYRGRTE